MHCNVVQAPPLLDHLVLALLRRGATPPPQPKAHEASHAREAAQQLTDELATATVSGHDAESMSSTT